MSGHLAQDVIDLGDSDDDAASQGSSSGSVSDVLLTGATYNAGDRYTPIEVFDDSHIIDGLATPDLFSPPPRQGSPASPIFVQRGSRSSGYSSRGAAHNGLGGEQPWEAGHDDGTAQASLTNLSPQRLPPLDEGATLMSTFDCPICMCSPTDVVCTPCGHVFCGECLFSSLHTTRTTGGPMASVQLDEEIRRSLAGDVGPRGRRGRSGRGTRRRGRGGLPTGQRIDLLAGRCPVCRAVIPGGFDVGAYRGGNPTTLPKIVGLKLKLGVPSDDPRKPHSARPQVTTSPPPPPAGVNGKGKRRRKSTEKDTDMVEILDSSSASRDIAEASRSRPPRLTSQVLSRSGSTHTSRRSPSNASYSLPGQSGLAESEIEENEPGA